MVSDWRNFWLHTCRVPGLFEGSKKASQNSLQYKMSAGEGKKTRHTLVIVSVIATLVAADAKWFIIRTKIRTLQ